MTLALQLRSLRLQLPPPPTDATEDLGAAPNDSGDGLAPFPNMEVGSGGGDEASTP
jgi:hypothetical protein